MKTNNKKYILFLLIVLGMTLSNFDCCTTSCLKRTFAWDEYTQPDYFDNSTIMNSEEFKSFQQKYPLIENEIDIYSKKLAPELVKWFAGYDSIFQDNSEITAKLRINSKGNLENLRILNTFKFDTNRVNVLKDMVKNIRFKTWTDTLVQVEFSIKIIKGIQGVNVLKIDKAYSVIGRRTKEEIFNTVNSNLKSMRSAFQYELNSNFCAHGKITVRFDLREDGSIPKCKVIESSYCDSTFETKIVKMVSSWKFPPMMTTYDITEIVYPFIFGRE